MDYASALAKELYAAHSTASRFYSWSKSDATSLYDCKHSCGKEQDLGKPEAIILHYVNYGYHPRGIPMELPRTIARYVKEGEARLLVMFHELYASGPPWKSEFWLRPLQVGIARKLITLADVCFASNKTIADVILVECPFKPIRIVPVMSTLGEPCYTEIPERSSRHWAICGGTSLISRSLKSFICRMQLIPDEYQPEELDVIGGKESAEIRALIGKIRANKPGIVCNYYPEVSVEAASRLLTQCSFTWLDYFGDGKAWPGMIFKSTSFAASCAHGIIPVLSHEEADATPVSCYFIKKDSVRLPSASELPGVRQRIYDWYHAHASAAQVARVYAGDLR